MIANGFTLEKIYSEAMQLSTEERLRLVQQVIESIIALPPSRVTQPLRYGQFADPMRPLSTEQDFVIAEWHPTEQQLNGG